MIWTPHEVLEDSCRRMMIFPELTKSARSPAQHKQYGLGITGAVRLIQAPAAAVPPNDVVPLGDPRRSRSYVR